LKRRFSKIYPIEIDVKIFYPIVALITTGSHELDKTDSTLCQEALM
jgi:hypothetical protein